MRRSSLPLALALLLVSRGVVAQVSDADRATARKLAQQGQEALDHKDYTTAVDRFDRARQLIPAPTIALGLARAQVGLGKLVAAQETYARIVREGVAPGASAVFTKAVADARTELDALEPRIPTVVIELKGAPSAKVTLDGAVIPAAALGVSRPVDPGKHGVRAEADGFLPAEASFTVDERKSERVALTLVPAPTQANDALKADASAAPAKSSPMRTVGFVGIGLGGAGLILGGITGAMALGKHSELAPLCPMGHCTNQGPAIDQYHLYANLSTAGFVVGGAFAVTGIVLAAIAPKAPAPPVAMSVGPCWIGGSGSF
jgi:hypothetical protein